MSEDKKDLFLYYWDILCRDLPAPEPEFKFHSTRKWRFDWAWPRFRIAVEVDGGQWTKFGGRHMTDADRDKINAAASLGWRVYHFSPTQLKHDPNSCIALVADNIRQELDAS